MIPTKSSANYMISTKSSANYIISTKSSDNNQQYDLHQR